ncbi:beta-lactamase/transpeptidase-like protein [Emericellopsis atlantica]|uniref:Beta-lactamase/transpeptidase-like protein n=1 Tax=Emericellopsis atlantica TaxID=2614577 RepID=A0A9P7ZK72_9HYPO|nr:beta-lactamase/transpeptidase-like protein [Emericellopsis atlantica]KAG9253643.1 beta-lactamase/transpeptidase-like protein [Emericellopsis atlantica]
MAPPRQHARLRDITPLIESLRKSSGAPGLAIGVIHRGKIVHEQYVGYRDVENKAPVDENTLFYVASLNKSMTATCVGILVEDGELGWDTPIHDILPELSKDSPLCLAKLNVADVLSHRTGKAWADALYLESGNRILLPRKQSIPIINHIPQVAPVRSKYMYNNHMYNLAGLVIERSNAALPYNILSNREPWELPQCNASSETMMFAGQSVRTSMAELLQYATAYFEAAEKISPHSDGKDKAPDGHKSPLMQIEGILQPHICRRVPGALLEQTYGLGWNRTQLPGSLDFGWKSSLVDDFPRLGEKTGTAVVVLQNSLGLCDVADLVSQAVVDTLMVGKPMRDYLDLANRCAAKSVLRMDEVEAKLEQEGILNTKPRELEAYVGRYMNSAGNWFIDICISESEGLQLRVLGLEEETYELRHYHYDTFAWNQSYDEMVKRAQYIRAGQKDCAGITQLRWRHDRTVPEGEVFQRLNEA